MGINTSEITSAASDGDISLNPNGTGKVQLTKLAGGGEQPVGAAGADGEIKAFDHRDLTPLSAVDANDLLLVQRGADYFTVDASSLGGSQLGDPLPRNISWRPSDPPGSGTAADPYRLTPVTVAAAGGIGTSVETMIVSGMSPDVIIPIYDESNLPAKGRFEQQWLTCDNNGTVETQFFYRDAPISEVPLTYSGIIKVGPTTVWVTWDVTQRTNKTQFEPAPAPTASPTTVDYAADGKYGTVSGFWADGPQTLEATGLVFSVNDGSLDSFNKLVEDGNKVTVGFVDATVAAAAEGATITGSLSSTDDKYFNEFVMVKDVTPTAFTLASKTDQATSAEANVSFGSIRGINAPTSITAAGSSADPLTSVEVSINGEAPAPVSGGTFNPGDTLEGYGTTGSSTNTTYQATFTLGGVDGTWDVTTTGVGAAIAQPSITSPVNGAFNLTPDVTVIGSDYEALNGAGAHSSSDWEVYETDLGALSTGVITATEELSGAWQIGSVAFKNFQTSFFGGGLFLAGGLFSGIYYSTDGISWSPATMPVLNGGGSVFAIGYDGSSTYVALADLTNNDDPTAYYSTDGINWSIATTLPTFSTVSQGGAVTYANGKFVAVCGGANALATSTDGRNWTMVADTVIDNDNWSSITYAAGYFVAVSPYTTGNALAYSTNGTTWTNVTGVSGRWKGITYGNGVFVGVGDESTTLYSTDGTNWQEVTTPSGDWTGVAFGNGTFVAVAQFGSTTTAAMYSYDGLNWNYSGVTPMGDWQCIAFGNNMFSALGNNGANGRQYTMHSRTGTGTDQTTLTLADGTNLSQFTAGTDVVQDGGGTPETSAITNVGTLSGAWGIQSSPTVKEWSSIAYGANKFVSVSSYPFNTGVDQVMYSADGISWTMANSSEQNAWKGVSYGNGLFIAVGFSGSTGAQAMYSTDGINWTSETGYDHSTQNPGKWTDSVYGGGMYVAVGDASSTSNPQFMYSTDGNDWVSTNSGIGGSNRWRGVTYGNGKFVAVSIAGFGVFGAYSNDGINWVGTALTPNSGWSSVTYGNGLFVAVASSGADRVATSTDGINWTYVERGSYPAKPWDSVEYGNGLFLAVSSQATTQDAMWSRDGITWTSSTTPTNSNGDNPGWWASAYGGKWVSVSGNTFSFGTPSTDQVMTSATGGPDQTALTLTDDTNLVNLQVDDAVDKGTVLSVTPASNQMTIAPFPPGWVTAAAATNNTWISVTHGDGKFVAVSYNGTDQSMYSTDGVSWTSSTPPALEWRSVIYENAKFVAVASGGTGNRSMYSTDGINWTLGQNITQSDWQDLAYGNGAYIAVAKGGANRISRSVDGITWTTPGSAPEANRWSSVAYGNGTWAAVSQDGNNRAMYSTNGSTWASSLTASKPQANSWESVTYGNGLFVAVASTGTNRAMWSTDGISWSSSVSGVTANSWYGVTFNGGTFTAVGLGCAMYSTDGKNWTSVTVENTQWESVIYGGDRFVSVASTGPGTSRVMWNINGTETVPEYSNGDTVTGPTLTAATGTIGSVDTSANTITLSASDQTGDKRWLVTEAGYETAKKLNKRVSNPLIPATPGAPTTEPPSSEYTSVTPSAETLTTATLDDTNLNANKVYYSRVKYSDGSISSEFSAYNEFVTKDFFPPDVGDEFGGGYFAGQINDNGTIYNLIVAPVTSGGLTGQYGGATPLGVKYKTGATTDSPGNVYRNEVHGAGATTTGADASHPMFNWVVNDSSGPNAGKYNAANTRGTGIGGFNDWYIPAKNELEIVYRSLKPTTDPNDTDSGANENAVPSATSNYTAGSPTQTIAAVFQSGGSQAFPTGTNEYYWSSSQYANINAWKQIFGNGDQSNATDKTNILFARAVRRAPA